jgi:hypothetical protein
MRNKECLARLCCHAKLIEVLRIKGIQSVDLLSNICIICNRIMFHPALSGELQNKIYSMTRTSRSVLIAALVLGVFCIKRASAQRIHETILKLSLSISGTQDEALAQAVDSIHIDTLPCPYTQNYAGVCDHSTKRFYFQKHNTIILRTSVGTLLKVTLTDPASSTHEIVWSSWVVSPMTDKHRPESWWSSEHLRGPNWTTTAQDQAKQVVRGILSDILESIRTAQQSSEYSGIQIRR